MMMYELVDFMVENGVQIPALPVIMNAQIAGAVSTGSHVSILYYFHIIRDKGCPKYTPLQKKCNKGKVEWEVVSWCTYCILDNIPYKRWHGPKNECFETLFNTWFRRSREPNWGQRPHRGKKLLTGVVCSIDQVLTLKWGHWGS